MTRKSRLIYVDVDRDRWPWKSRDGSSGVVAWINSVTIRVRGEPDEEILAAFAHKQVTHSFGADGLETEIIGIPTADGMATLYAWAERETVGR